MSKGRRMPMLPADFLDDPVEYLAGKARSDDVALAREMAKWQHDGPSDAGWAPPWGDLSARQQACAVLAALDWLDAYRRAAVACPALCGSPS